MGMNPSTIDPAKLALLLGTVPDSLSNQVNEVVDRYMTIAEQHWLKPFPRPKITYDLRGSTAGWAKGTSEIQLNGELLMNPETQERMLSQTVPHEVAHIIQHHMYPYSTAHGHEWKRIMRLFCLPPDRTHTMKTKAARKTRKFAYQCPCTQHIIGLNVHKKIQAGSRYTCRYCGGVLNRETAREVKTKNV